MTVYLVRHGEAKSEAEDSLRPLTEGGVQAVERVAKFLARAGISITRIVHSGKLRAQQTAEIMAAHLSPPQGISELEGLAPMDDPEVAKAFLERAKGSVMVCGHLPHLSRLASLLVLNDVRGEIVDIPTAGVVALRESEGRWKIVWMLIPDLL